MNKTRLKKNFLWFNSQDFVSFSGNTLYKYIFSSVDDDIDYWFPELSIWFPQVEKPNLIEIFYNNLKY
jgi:hypothetical protein